MHIKVHTPWNRYSKSINTGKKTNYPHIHALNSFNFKYIFKYISQSSDICIEGLWKKISIAFQNMDLI